MKRWIRCTVTVWICCLLLAGEALAARIVVPVGEVIGIELQDGTVTVAAIDETLGENIRAAGVQTGDRILKIDGKEITEAGDVRYQLERSDGTVELELEREQA